MSDPVDKLRLGRRYTLNVEQHCDTRQEAEHLYGRVWDPEQLAEYFEVVGFLSPYAIVRRKSDGRLGSLEYQHDPRWYFAWSEHES